MFIASVIGIVFVFGIILVIGWLTACNMLGEFRDKSSNLVQKFCDATNILSVLFVSIQKFVTDPRSKKNKRNLFESIDDAGDLIDRLTGVDSFGSKFSKLFKDKVKVYGSRKSNLIKDDKLRKLNGKIGELIGGPNLAVVLDQIDSTLINEPDVNIGSLIVKAINSLTMSLGAEFN